MRGIFQIDTLVSPDTRGFPHMDSRDSWFRTYASHRVLSPGERSGSTFLCSHSKLSKTLKRNFNLSKFAPRMLGSAKCRRQVHVLAHAQGRCARMREKAALLATVVQCTHLIEYYLPECILGWGMSFRSLSNFPEILQTTSNFLKSRESLRKCVCVCVSIMFWTTREFSINRKLREASSPDQNANHASRRYK